MRKGLLLGAGFSVELGMPMANEFSKAFLSFLSHPSDTDSPTFTKDSNYAYATAQCEEQCQTACK